MRASSARGGRMRARAAASSIASGRPSSICTSDSMATRSACTDSAACPAAAARTKKSALASSTSNGGRLTVCSPAMPNSSRVVTRKRASGARSSQRPSVPSAWLASCSKLSKITRQAPRPANAWPSWITGSSLASVTSSPWATARRRPSTLRADDRSQNHAPPGRSPSERHPKRSASRVLPVPPKPVNDTSRAPASKRCCSSRRAAWRPMNASRSAGKPWRTSRCGSHSSPLRTTR